MRYPEVNSELQTYVEKHIFPEYVLNDPGHQIGHIHFCIRRSLGFAKQLGGINCDSVYAIAAYHDIAHHINYLEHERLSAERFQQDRGVHRFFEPEEIKIIAEAIYDHRSTMDGEPRSVYGKIVSSADRNVSVKAALTRSFEYRVAHGPETSIEEKIEGCRKHLIEKYGRDGYAVHKFYFSDPEYDKYLQDLGELLSDPAEFNRQIRIANNLNTR